MSDAAQPKKPTTPDVLAVKWGYNPNSSSLGVDVTFLLLGTTALTLVTPLVGWWLRRRATERAVTPAP